ncbi:MAG: hypothetical protein JWP08_2876 [Bryobacterales bacterium]|nr:hypothetical protein [Bryobacterales bacterium]
MTSVPEMEFTLPDFKRAGGLKRAIDKHAEAVFAQFPNEHLAIQMLFQRITDLGDGERPIRRPEIIPVLSAVAGLTTERLQVIVGAFVERGLLVQRRLENGETEVDLPHECVAWKWDRLTRWISDEAAAAKSLRFLQDSVAKGQWLTGSVLSEAQAFREGGRLDGAWPRRYLSENEVSRVRGWTDKSEEREESERLRLVRERRRAEITSIVATIIALTMGGLGFWAFNLKKSADTERRNAQIALARSAVQDGIEQIENRNPAEPGQAVGYFARAIRSAPNSVAAMSWLTDQLIRSTWWLPVSSFRHQNAVSAAAFSPDGRRVVTASEDHTARVWEVFFDCCDSQREANRLAWLAEIISGVAVNDTGALSAVEGDRRQQMAELARSAKPKAQRLSLDWLITEFARQFRLTGQPK